MDELSMNTLLAAWMIGGALMGAIIGNWRGRLVAGLIWGALLGVIGWALVGFGPDARKPKSAPCPYCLQPMPLLQRECAHCKHDVLWVQGKPRKRSGLASNISQ